MDRNAYPPRLPALAISVAALAFLFALTTPMALSKYAATSILYGKARAAKWALSYQYTGSEVANNTAVYLRAGTGLSARTSSNSKYVRVRGDNEVTTRFVPMLAYVKSDQSSTTSIESANFLNTTSYGTQTQGHFWTGEVSNAFNITSLYSTSGARIGTTWQTIMPPKEYQYTEWYFNLSASPTTNMTYRCGVMVEAFQVD